MKPFLISWQTNYGTAAYVINASSPEEALTIAKVNGAWDDAEAAEINLTTPGIVAIIKPTD